MDQADEGGLREKEEICHQDPWEQQKRSRTTRGMSTGKVRAPRGGGVNR
jgi:hypothetical protein